MTREEQIIKLVDDYKASDPVANQLLNRNAAFGLVRHILEWADEHPHWISVEDRKPKLKHSADNMKYSDTVIVTNGKYRISANWMYNTWAGWYGWFTGGDEELKDVTYWMPMPEPPKEGGEK